MYKNKTFGSTLLVAGTSMGAGMLALPLKMGASGFIWTSLLFVLSCLFMLVSIFLVLEANLMATKEDANIISMVKERLGSIGESFAWVFFLLLLYSVASAYLSGGGSLIADVLSSLFHTEISANTGVFIFLVVFGFSVVFGTRAVDLVNRLCMIGLIVSFFSLLIFVVPHVEIQNLSGGKPRYLMAGIPIAILSFTSHLIVPSLRVYLKGNLPKLKCAFLWGSFIPLAFYLCWQFIIVGTLPLEGKYGLEALGGSDYPLAKLSQALNVILGIRWIAAIFSFFSFLALVTSFFGVALSLYDFLADGCHIKKDFFGNLILLFLMFIPPLLFALFFKSGFLIALGYGGVFVAVLYGILPALMVWQGRYIENKKAAFRVFGGKPLLILMIFGSVCVIFFQIAATKGWLPIL